MAKKTVTVPNAPLAESDGSFGHHVEKPTPLTKQKVRGKTFVELAPLAIEQTVNATTHRMPGRKY